MKKRIQSLSWKEILWIAFVIICLILSAIILWVEHLLQKDLADQQMAVRWSEKQDVAQISCFFAEGMVEDADYFRSVEQGVEKALLEASIVAEKKNARLWIDAVSRNGKVVLKSDRATVELNAVGVKGEFFQFHPLYLLNGFFFHQNSMMQDGIVIDEETAWQLFGSEDVAGMQVMIGQVPHYITGVVQKETGRLQKAAGLNQSVCYLSLDSLEQYGSVTGGFFYEIVMPNPIDGFAFSTISSTVGYENHQDKIQVIENSRRYDIFPLFEVIQDFGIRSMSQKGIVYPYWENIARGYEDIFALTFMIKILLILQPCIFFIFCMIRLWKKRTWTLEKGIQWISDKVYDIGVKRNQKRNIQNKERKEKV